MTRECPREPDVLEAVVMGAWPDACDESLRAHVSSCAICRDVADVAAALREDQREVSRVANIPGSGVVWWRAQMRARAEAARAASTPITFVQGIAAACILGAGIAVIGSVFPMARSWVVSVFDFTSVVHATAGEAAGMASLWRWLPLVALMPVLLVPVAIYLAVTDD